MKKATPFFIVLCSPEQWPYHIYELLDTEYVQYILLDTHIYKKAERA